MIEMMSNGINFTIVMMIFILALVDLILKKIIDEKK